MGPPPPIDLKRLAKAVALSPAQVERTVALLDAGNTIPFITRYRRDQTGGLDEQQITEISSGVAKLRQIEDRRSTILRLIDARGELTAALADRIAQADSLKHLEDLYLPYRPKRESLATQARAQGLEGLAEQILSAGGECPPLSELAAQFVTSRGSAVTADDALAGAGHIVVEGISERADLRSRVRKIFRRSARIMTVKGEGDDKRLRQFSDYFDFCQPAAKLLPHRVLAINRGERLRLLRVRIDTALEAIEREAVALVVPEGHPYAEFLRGCVRDSLGRVVLPSLQRELRRDLTERAEAHAVNVFARNLRNLLLLPPLRERRVLAIDPGLKSGCKLAALDGFGNVIDQAVVHMVGSDQRLAESRAKLNAMLCEHDLSLVAIGNGTGCREATQLVAELLSGELAGRDVAFMIVNEAGASVYSTSALAREELPDSDATLRGAVSIGRRVQDPLSELVKIDPASMGVGLYQHDAKSKHLRASLDAVVQSCVNFVGVDLNTASPSLLRYVSGLNQLTARRLYEHRRERGPFRSREQLREVPGIGEATFVQAAGFLKIEGFDEPLDATWIHPESYDVATKVLHKLDLAAKDLKERNVAAVLEEHMCGFSQETLAQELNVGSFLLQDILDSLRRPGRDPREDFPPPIFHQGIARLEDLKEGMELAGAVLNVVDFGAFVDIGLADSGLVHISQLASRYVRDPHEVVCVGQRVRVWVTSIDRARRRVSLTMIEPGSPRPQRPESPRSRPRRPPRSPARPGAADAPPVLEKRVRTAKPTLRRSPAKLVPLTKAMEEGREPMRTFGDLLQFHRKKSEKPKDG
jgi:uncharacterized protein